MFVALFCLSLLVWHSVPAARRRIRFVWALLLASLLLWFTATLSSAPLWIRPAELALEELVALHLVVMLVFYVALRRFRIPRILSDLAIGCGYGAIILGMLMQVGVNLTGIIATSAVATAVIGFGLQDLMGNLASGLTLQIEQAISVGDWVRTEHYFGQVLSVRIRHTAIETPDGDTILAPNSALTRSPVTILGRASDSVAQEVSHRKAVTFHLPYGHSPSSVIAAVEQALQASHLEGIAAEPKARCVTLDFHPQYVQYAALVWMTRPRLELLDISGVRTRINFALSRLGEPLVSIPYLLDHRHETAPPAETEIANRQAALRRIESFAAFGVEELRHLATGLKSESFGPGEVILRQGGEGGSAYIVNRGAVRILLTHGEGLSEQLAVIGPGGFFGEMSLLTGEPRTASAVALEQVDCYLLSKADLDPLFAAHPDLVEKVSTLLAERQAGLAAAREKLGEKAERQRLAESQIDLLTRIRRYFSLA